jgi:hypothetical protein
MSHIHDKLLSSTNVRQLKYEVLMSKYFQHDLTVISNDNDPLALQLVDYFMALLKDPLLGAWKSLDIDLSDHKQCIMRRLWPHEGQL